MKKAVIMINAFLVAALIGLISFNNKVEMVGTQCQHHNSLVTSLFAGAATAGSAGIGEKDVFPSGVGDAVVVTTDAYPGWKIAGKVKIIAVEAGESHTYPVRVGIANDEPYPLKPAMFDSVVSDPGKQAALIVQML